MDCELGSRFLFLYLKHEISTLRKKNYVTQIVYIVSSCLNFLSSGVRFYKYFYYGFSSFPALFSYFHKKNL